MVEHPLDRPVWHALTGLQERYARGAGAARRFDPAIGPLAAARRDDEAGLAALAALMPAEGVLATAQMREHALPPGAVLARRSLAVQMVAQKLPDRVEDSRIVPLGDADAPAMLALALLTEPGPFAERTHVLGRFWGIYEEGRLIAMAGERMQLQGFGEVSAVCVHPDARGRGLGALMTRKAMHHVAARGLVPFLHCYADNAAAIRTYERLGFCTARELIITMFARAPVCAGADVA